MPEEITLYFKRGHDKFTRTVENLKETNDLETGQVFLSIAKYHEKTPADYPRWISFSKNRGEFDAIDSILRECTCDFDRVNLVNEWLGEESFD